MTLVDEAPASADPSDAEPRAGSLLPVLRVIPAEAYENPTWKGLAYFARDLFFYALAVAALVRWSSPLVVVPVWALLAVVMTGLFVVAHDCAHQALFKQRWLNDLVGRIAMLPNWHVYEGWVLGHNRVHHAFTVREGYDFVWHPYTAEQYRAMTPLARLRHRVEWSWFGAGAYYLREVWWKKMIAGKPPKRWQKPVRHDRILVGSFVALATAGLTAAELLTGGSIAGAVWLVARVLVVPFLLFNFMIGSLVHVHHIQPDIRWWKKADWTKFKGQMDGTTVLRAPAPIEFFFHGIMLHVPHHVDMRIPMYNLDLAAKAIIAAYPDTVDERPLRFRDFVRNTRQCKLYDFDAGRWMTYRQALAA